MALRIVDGCIVCGACEPDARTRRITAADPLYLPTREMPECVGA